MSTYKSSIAKDVYERSRAELSDASNILNEGDIAALAQEVLKRIAARASRAQAVSDHLATKAELKELCLALISDDEHAGQALIDNVKSEGATLEEVYLSYLTGAAHMLGDWWSEDRVSFLDVTLGSFRIYAIMRALNVQFAPPIASSEKLALLAAAPGETHTLGAKAAADLLEQRGWSIVLKAGFCHERLLDEVGVNRYPIIGLSAAGAHATAALARAIVAIRLQSPGSKVVVGGYVVEDAPQAIAAMRPDAAFNAMTNVYDQMEALLPA